MNEFCAVVWINLRRGSIVLDRGPKQVLLLKDYEKYYIFCLTIILQPFLM